MDKKSVKPLEELLDSVRDIDGFPFAEDEDILALSDAPFYTACPNPYIEKFIEEYGTFYDFDNDEYDKEPYVGDVSEGKNDKLYRAHTYHTKVPHKAIMHFIEHYTDPGNIVFDGFCGSGMTGLAAQLTGRKAILADLSPAATFIAYSYNHFTEKSLDNVMDEIVQTLGKVQDEWGWMFETIHTDKSIETRTNQRALIIGNKELKGNINYVIWSDVLICPYCNEEFIFWDIAVDKESEKVLDEFKCVNCNAKIKKNECEKSEIESYDPIVRNKVLQTKRVPAIIDYTFAKKRYRKKPDEFDLNIIEQINSLEIPYWYPNQPMMFKGEKWGDLWRKGSHFGITNVHQFYTKRALIILSSFWNYFDSKFSKFILTSLLSMRCTNRMPYRPGGRSAGTVNNLYIPSLIQEYNVIDTYKRKSKQIIEAFKEKTKTEEVLISTNAASDLRSLKKDSIDYIFTDPPFGSNIMYSEISFLWEAWLKVFTKIVNEAIVSNSQNKGLEEYKKIMTQSFNEFYRILKPNRWITIVFHNSRASVWNAIQEAITRAGFMIAQVSVLDKKQGSFRQVTSSGAVQNDLIINAYKPKKDFSQRFIINAGEDMEIDFVIEQMEHLPIKTNLERTEKMLYSKMLAHYVENGFKIKYNSTNFYKLLMDNFTELDGYWFLDKQVKDYNRWKSGLNLDQLKDILDGQQVLLVSDERTALTWIFNFLNEPKDFSEIYTAYQQISTKSSDEIPEIREMLDNNFILENGKYRRPLNEEERKEINKNREKELDRAFNKLLEQARTQKGKIKEVRKEALVHGFTKRYQEGKYQDILTIADKLYPSTLEASGDIMDFVDIARIKTSGQEEL